jgi:hypothetical protein
MLQLVIIFYGPGLIFGASPERMTQTERDALLRDTLILSFDMTVRDLLEEGRSVAIDTVAARNELILSAL